uniref:Nucleoside diphosphate kinase n=1 Tax=Sciurus vulgaris TaxID=55149 RepID=A0A8D2DM09_SCIVU
TSALPFLPAGFRPGPGALHLRAQVCDPNALGAGGSQALAPRGRPVRAPAGEHKREHRHHLRRTHHERRHWVGTLALRPRRLSAQVPPGGPSWTQERTLVAVKPDGVQRRLIGAVIQRFERRGFKLVGMKMLQAPESILAEHYQDLQRKPFYPALISYMSSGPVVAMVWEGYNVVRTSRAMIGHTDSTEAAPGTIRGDFSIHISRNIIHASDSVEGAQREIQLWFQSNELVNWADGGHHSSSFQA